MDPQAHVSVVSFTIAGRTALSILEAFEKRTGGSFGLRSGQFHSTNDMINLEGDDGVVRVSNGPLQY